MTETILIPEDIELEKLIVVDRNYNVGFIRFMGSKLLKDLHTINECKLSPISYFTDPHRNTTSIRSSYCYRRRLGPFELISPTTKEGYLKHISKRLHLYKEGFKYHKKKDMSDNKVLQNISEDIYEGEYRTDHKGNVYVLYDLVKGSNGDVMSFSSRLVLRGSNGREVMSGAIRKYNIDHSYMFNPITKYTIDDFVINTSDRLRQLEYAYMHNANQAVPFSYPVVI